MHEASSGSGRRYTNRTGRSSGAVDCCRKSWKARLSSKSPIIASDNIASIRVAEKNGMRHERDVWFEGYVDRLYVIDRQIAV